MTTASPISVHYVGLLFPLVSLSVISMGNFMTWDQSSLAEASSTSPSSSTSLPFGGDSTHKQASFLGNGFDIVSEQSGPTSGWLDPCPRSS